MKGIQKTFIRTLGAAGLTCCMAASAWGDAPPAPAPMAPADVAAACKQDVETLCPGVSPGEGRIAACLKANRRQLSAGCKQAIKERRREKSAASSTPAT